MVQKIIFLIALCFLLPALSVAKPTLTPKQQKTLHAYLQELGSQLKENPNNVQTWKDIGSTHFAMGNYKQALAAYRGASTLRPRDTGIRASMAKIYIHASDGRVIDPAVQLLKTVYKKHPENLTALYYLGLRAFQEGNAEAALGMWEQIRPIDTKDKVWHKDYVNYYVIVLQQQGHLSEDIWDSLTPNNAPLPPLPTLEEIGIAPPTPLKNGR